MDRRSFVASLCQWLTVGSLGFGSVFRVLLGKLNAEKLKTHPEAEPLCSSIQLYDSFDGDFFTIKGLTCPFPVSGFIEVLHQSDPRNTFKLWEERMMRIVRVVMDGKVSIYQCRRMTWTNIVAEDKPIDRCYVDIVFEWDLLKEPAAYAQSKEYPMWEPTAPECRTMIV